MAEHGHGGPEFVPKRDYPRNVGGNIASLISTLLMLALLIALLFFTTERDTPPIAYGLVGVAFVVILGKVIAGLRE